MIDNSLLIHKGTEDAWKYDAVRQVGQILSGEYWTSTERDSNTAWVFTFPGGNRFNSSKNGSTQIIGNAFETKRVRAIRAF